MRINIDDHWSMATIAESDTYHATRGNADWNGADDGKSQALVRAWDFLKSLEWDESVFSHEMPDDIKSAHMMAALEELKEPWVLLPILTSESFLKSKNTAGEIVKKYRTNAPAKKRFLAIEALLRPYVYSSSLNIRLERG